MEDLTPWIVVVTDGSVPKTLMRFRCNRCGNTRDLQFPFSANELGVSYSRFKWAHKECKEHDPQPPTE